MGEFRMPSLGADMDAGTVTEWLVKPGDDVQRGEIVAVVETEKSTIDVEIFETGRIDEILVPEGERVPVGTPLARVVPVGTPSAVPDASPLTPANETPEPSTMPMRPDAPVPAAATPAHPGALLSPVVRHLAHELGVDTSALAGSGPGGALTRADVEHAAARAPAPTRAAAARSDAGRTPGTPGHNGAAVRASPVARRLAAEAGVEVGALAPGSGPDGAVVEADVRRAMAGVVVPSETVVGAPARPRRRPDEPASSKQAAMRHAIGALMARSKREIPHYYLSTTIDMERASQWVAQANAARSLSSRLVMPVLLVKATGLAVASVPEMNGFMVDDRFEPSAAVHVGVAVSLRGGGVIAPAVHDVTDLTLDELMAKLHDVVDRARHGSLRSSEMSDPTITVTNLGDLGVESVFGVIYPPQVALVGFGRVQERPWAHDGMVGSRMAITATLSADHRASDGHRGGLFLSTIDKLLQKPEEL